jgi:septum formation protein
MRQIILASLSPRRKELLENAGIKFKVIDSKINEYFDPKLKPDELVKKLSLEKARAVRGKFKDAIIIAADTLVFSDGKILGKPRDQKDARKMLEFLSGKTHSLITGFTIIDAKTNKIITRSEETKVTMREISKGEIDSYLKTGEPFDKAGAYAIQGIAKKFIKRIDGDLSNAIGLPISTLLEDLKTFY